MSHATGSRARAGGFTLVELLLALGLFSLLMVAVVRLMSTSLDVLGESEVQRDQLGIEWIAGQWLVADLETLAGGADGDLLVDWWTFDHDGDGIATRPWPRLRLVRRASARDHLRLGLRDALAGDVDRELGIGVSRDPDAQVEVCWLALPVLAAAGEPKRGDAMLWRGERVVGGPGTSFFADGFLDARGRPPADAVSEVAGGLLWFDVLLADETSRLDRGWERGTDPGEVASAWDAHGRDRPDVDRHALNATLPRPAPDGVARLPRRIRVELEFERPRDRELRPRLATEVDAEATFFAIEDATRLPEPGGHLLIGEEWVEHLSTHGGGIAVRRAQRGTRATVHTPGTLVQWGRSFVREIAPTLYREDWRR